MTEPRIGRRLGAAVLLVAIVAGSAVALLAIELVAGLLLPSRAPGTPTIEGDAVSRTLAELDTNLAPLVPDEDLLWRNLPNAHKVQPVNPQPYGTQPTWTIDNDAEGFRGEGRHPSSTPVYRILCIGDSITFGFNVDQPDTYPKHLEDELARRYPSKRFEVVNAGVPGWTWIQGLEFLTTRGFDLAPDLVVMGHGTNDQFSIAKVTDEERFRALGGTFKRSAHWLARTLVHTNIYQWLGPQPERNVESVSPQCRDQIAETGACHRVSLPQIENAVSAVVRATRDAGTDLLLVNTDFLETPAFAATRRAADRVGASTLDLVAALASRVRDDQIGRAARLSLAPPLEPYPAEATSPVHAGRRVVFRVAVPDDTATYRVELQPARTNETPIFLELHDDGTGGDEKAGDKVHSATAELPATIAGVEYRYLRGDAPEFRPLPPLPSTLGSRMLRAASDGFAPVDEFGRSLFMAEQAHPNGNGQREIARLIADKLAEVDSFRRHAGEPAR